MKLGKEHFVQTDVIKRYAVDVYKYPLLTNEEFASLFDRYKAGDRSAQETLINSNLRFVMKVVAKVAISTDVSPEDLISEGNIGLMEALERFDPDKGVKFISFAVWYIRMYIYKAIDEVEPIIKPGSRVRKFRTSYREVVSRLTQRLERDPYPEEIQEEMGADEKLVNQLYFAFTKASASEVLKAQSQNAAKKTSSDVDALLSDEALNFPEEEGTLSNIAEQEEAEVDDEHREMMRLYVDELLSDLPERSANILVYLFGLRGNAAHSSDEVAEMFGLSCEYINELKTRALKAIKTNVLL